VRILGDRARFVAAVEGAGAAVVDGNGEALTVRAPATESGDGAAGPRFLFRAAADSGVVVRELSTMERNLEGAFLRAIEETA
jgi:hypothetical protein